MVYTHSARKNYNAQFLRMFPGVEYCKQEGGGTPYLYLLHRPIEAVQFHLVRELKVPQTVRPWNHVVPVLIRGLWADADGIARDMYMVNYVNCSEPSQRMLAEKLEVAEMYYLPGVAIEPPHNKLMNK